MSMTDINNTPDAWSDALRALADEARADAAARDSATVLAEILDDLSRVLDAYVVRLDGVERSVKVAALETTALTGLEKQAEQIEQEAEIPAIVEHIAATMAVADMDALTARIAALEARNTDLPGWIRSVLEDHHDRLVAVENAVVDLQDRITLLENSAQLTQVDVPQEMIAEQPIDPLDFRPEAWGSIERARQALSNRVHREHRKRATVRQTVLNAVTALAIQQNADPATFSEDDRAQLRQHQERANILAEIDVVRDVKLDEIAALDDLEIARAYEAEGGWPG